MHKISGRWKYGLLLALSTMVMWGVLPILLKGLEEALDPLTVTFARFFLAAALLTPYLVFRGNLQNPHLLLSLQTGGFLLLAGVFLAANYIAYILGLERSTAEASQVVIQIAPMLLLLCGVLIFRERLSATQWLGFATFVIGLGLFFHQRMAELFISVSNYGLGIWLVVLAGLFWTVYAILQKFLLKSFNSPEIMMSIYWLGALIFLPFSDFSTLSNLNSLHWILLLFCGLNTLIAYGCFAEALAHWEASRISATVTLAPLVTVGIVQLIPLPGVAAETLTIISFTGALLVVIGSMMAALTGSNK